MLRLDKVAISLGSTELLIDLSWHLRPGRRVGLVGRNGVGKTTLLRLIAGELQPSGGQVFMRGGVRAGTLPQQAVSGSERTVWEEARSRMDWLHDLEARLKRAQQGAERGEEGAAARLGQVTEEMRLKGAFAVEERIGEVLHGLGFSPEDWQRSCATFSGGWQMRIALARLLLSAPDLLLLDEPTNHLDIVARSWLADFLKGCGSTMVVVSHDRHLLDAVCTDIVELHGRTLQSFSGNLSAWLVERERREAALVAAREAQDAEIEHLQRFVDRFGAKATKASQAQSRQKRLDRIERIEAPSRESRPRLQLPDAPPGALEPVTLRGVSLGWEGGPDVLTGVDLALERGMRLAVLGPNGGGKSTLLGGIAGTLVPRRGQRVQGRDVRLMRYAQDLAQELPPAESAIDAASALAPLATTQRIRAALGALGLVGEAQLRRVDQLSGGQKARVVLAAFASRAANLLLLDEPTNHLDVVTADELARALSEYEGTVVFVTHDRWLVERLATHVVQVEGGRAVFHPGVFPEDFLPPEQRRGSDGRGPSAASPTAPSSEGREDWSDRKARQRELGRARRRLAQVEQEIHTGEAALAALDQRLAEVAGAPTGDHRALAALAADRASLVARIEAAYQEWEALVDATGDSAGPPGDDGPGGNPG